MTNTATVPSLHGEAMVELPVDQAFAFFTDSIGRWWPAEYHIGPSDMVDTILESAQVAGGTNAAPTAASANGARCWSGNHHTGWSSPGRSTATGNTTTTLTAPARSRSGSALTDRIRPSSS